jgi:putative tricarboxylic transport membrane protein
MIMHNIQPGPQVMASNPALFWGLIASMWIGNLILVILNLPLVGIWVRLLTIPYNLLYPAIILFSCIGIYSSRYADFDLYLAAGFGVAGYVFRKLGCEPAPLVLGFILGPMMEGNFQRAMVLSSGDVTVFLRQPISLAFLGVAVVLLVLTCSPRFRKKRDEMAAEEE